MSDRGFLTDKNRDVLLGRYEGSEGARRNQESRIRSRTAAALNDLVAVADSGNIDNADAFDPDQVYALLVSLTIDRDTTGSGDPNDPHHKEINDEFRREVLEAVDAFRVTYHKGYGPGEPDELD